MSFSLYEQFLAAGSVKSLLTGKEYPSKQTPSEQSGAPVDSTASSPLPQTDEMQ